MGNVDMDGQIFCYEKIMPKKKKYGKKIYVLVLIV